MNYLPILFSLSLVITVSQQTCPNGWHQSSIYPEKCYFIVTKKLLWFDAQSFCSNAAQNGFLTSIASAYETYNLNAVVIDTPFISSCDQMWIGGNDFQQSGQFVWNDGRPFQYTNWATGQPDLTQQCVSATARTTGKWKTELCGVENCFICETNTTTWRSTSTPLSTTTTTATTTTATTTQTSTVIPTGTPTSMTDCWDWFTIGGASNDGIYPINPGGQGQFNVYCDMTTDGGGWTMFQRRIDNSLIFWTRTWLEYKNGFNNGLDQNHWLGLDKLHVLSTKDASVTLRIDLKGDRCYDAQSSGFIGTCNAPVDPNGYWWGEYLFSVTGEDRLYTLHTSLINAGNLTHRGSPGFGSHDGNSFSTVDRDNTPAKANCTSRYETGGWWDRNCDSCALNGKYNVDSGYLGLYCHSNDYDIVPTVTEMKLRRHLNSVQ